MGEKQEEEREIEAPFNMAIATLERLHTILQQITRLDLIFPSDNVDKQKTYIKLVKQFFINAAPLYPNVETEEYKNLKKEILSMKIKAKPFVISGTQKMGQVYDPKLNERLDTILVEMQQKLKKFFMPSRKGAASLI